MSPLRLLGAGLLVLAAGVASGAPRPLLPKRRDVAPVGSGAFSPPILLRERASFGAARLGDWLYVYSGHAGPTHKHSLDNLNQTFVRHSLSGGASELLPMGEPVQSVLLLAYGESLIRVGGMTARNRAGQEEDLHSIKTVARYDPAARKWTALPALPEARSSHGAAILGDTLYVLGGWSLAGDIDTWPKTGWQLDLSAEAPAWKAWEGAPFSPRRAVAMVAVADRLVLMGGMLSEGNFSKEVHVFEPKTQRWSKGPDLPFFGFGMAAQGKGHDLYTSGLDSPLYRMSFAGGELEWEQVTSLMFPRYFHELIDLGGDRLLAVGGVTRPLKSPGNVHLRTTEVLTTSPKAEPVFTTWTIPAPGRAKNRQAAFLFFDDLWVFGGNDSVAQHDFGPEHFLSEGFRLRLGTQRFLRLEDFPRKRQSCRTLVRGGVGSEPFRGLSVGGFGHTGQNTASFAEAFVFDFRAKTWKVSPHVLPKPRTQFGLTEHEGALYAFGGLDYDSTRPRKEAFSFPTQLLKAEAGAFEPTGVELPQPRRAFGGALLGGNYYLVGGMKQGFKLLEDVDVYDFEAKTWSKVPAPRDPRIAPHLIALGGKLYLIGGTTPRGGEAFVPNQRVEVFDPQSGAWSTLVEELPVSVRHMQFFPWRDRILCYTAQHAGSPTIRLLVIEP